MVLCFIFVVPRHVWISAELNGHLLLGEMTSLEKVYGSFDLLVCKQELTKSAACAHTCVVVSEHNHQNRPKCRHMRVHGVTLLLVHVQLVTANKSTITKTHPSGSVLQLAAAVYPGWSLRERRLHISPVTRTTGV